MSKNKTAAELRAENKLLRKFRITEGFAAVIMNAIRWGGLVLIARYFYLGLAALAGKQTNADIGINVLSEMRMSESLAWLLGGSGVAYGMAQRRLRRSTVERLHGRIKKLETAHDAQRSSSELTTRGETRQEDKL